MQEGVDSMIQKTLVQRKIDDDKLSHAVMMIVLTVAGAALVIYGAYSFYVEKTGPEAALWSTLFGILAAMGGLQYEILRKLDDMKK
jgi:hypothetical protein